MPVVVENVTVNAADSGFDSLEEMKFLFHFLRSGVEAPLSSATQHAISPEFVGK